MQVNRNEAGSAVLEKPKNDRRTDGGNLQLMEARLTQLYSSLRALYRSNSELQEALADNPMDRDFLVAVEENWETMRNQRALAMELVSEMKQRGANIDLPLDICEMDIPAHKKKKEPSSEPQSSATTESETGIYL